MNITEIPVDLTSKLFRGTMPYEITTEEKILLDLKTNMIKQIVLLCPADECEFSTGTDLKAVYEENNIKVINFPIIDKQVPELDNLRNLIEEIYTDLSTSDQKNTLVHCKGGTGRTGLVIACLVRRIFTMNHKDAIDWVRKYIPGAVETPIQIQMLKNLFASSSTSLSNQIDPISSSSVTSSENLVELPLDLTSKLYKGVMPLGIANNPSILENFKQHKIKRIVMLCTEKEYKFATSTDLKALYIQNGFEVTHLPIVDTGIPTHAGMENLLSNILTELSKPDNNILVHCMSGSRTGMVAACLARKLFGYDANEAIEWMENYIPKGLAERQYKMIQAIN